MSFICQICKKSQPSGSRPELVTTKTRDREYIFGEDGFAVGNEIVEEKRACPSCATGSVKVHSGLRLESAIRSEP